MMPQLQAWLVSRVVRGRGLIHPRPGVKIKRVNIVIMTRTPYLRRREIDNCVYFSTSVTLIN